MHNTLEYESGLIFSIKTFRPLWIFPWLSSVWRQFPFATCIATVSYSNKQAAEEGHQELVALLKSTHISSDMSEAFKSIQDFCKERVGSGVKSYRIYPGHAVEGKVDVEIKSLRRE